MGQPCPHSCGPPRPEEPSGDGGAGQWSQLASPRGRQTRMGTYRTQRLAMRQGHETTCLLLTATLFIIVTGRSHLSVQGQTDRCTTQAISIRQNAVRPFSCEKAGYSVLRRGGTWRAPRSGRKGRHKRTHTAGLHLREILEGPGSETQTGEERPPGLGEGARSSVDRHPAFNWENEEVLEMDRWTTGTPQRERGGHSQRSKRGSSALCVSSHNTHGEVRLFPARGLLIDTVTRVNTGRGRVGHLPAFLDALCMK